LYRTSNDVKYRYACSMKTLLFVGVGSMPTQFAEFLKIIPGGNKSCPYTTMV
jgi:hypothetical protein